MAIGKNRSGVLSLAMAALILAATFLSGAGMAQSKGKQQTLAGTVTDAMCGAKHGMMGDVSDKECVLGCVKGGSKYGLVVGEKVYELNGKEGDLEKLAGAQAKVSGTVDGDQVQVVSVSPK